MDRNHTPAPSTARIQRDPPTRTPIRAPRAKTPGATCPPTPPPPPTKTRALPRAVPRALSCTQPLSVLAIDSTRDPRAPQPSTRAFERRADPCFDECFPPRHPVFPPFRVSDATFPPLPLAPRPRAPTCPAGPSGTIFNVLHRDLRSLARTSCVRGERGTFPSPNFELVTRPGPSLSAPHARLIPPPPNRPRRKPTFDSPWSMSFPLFRTHCGG